jgi:hypothetical protein
MAPVWPSISCQRVFTGVVIRFTSTMSSSHSMPGGKLPVFSCVAGSS